MDSDTTEHAQDQRRDSATTAAAPPPRGSRGRLGRLCLKELREILRDRRTIVTLLLMPLIVYPLLSIAFKRLLITSVETSTKMHCVIGLNVGEAQPRVQRFLNLGEVLLRRERNAAEVQPGSGGGSSPPDESTPQIRWMTGNNLDQEVAATSLDLAILIDDPAGDPAADVWGRPLRCELIYRENSAVSKLAFDYVNERFRAVNEDFLRQRMQELGLAVELPIQTARRPVGGSGAAFSLTTLIPLILILMTITGAVYPAIDLTAGERERGTLEALMAAPVPRMLLLAAKYVAVVTVALLTAGANLVAMTITLTATGLGGLLFGPAGLSLTLVAKVFALLMLSAGFYSAILLALTSFARSFKEAQAYLIPLMLLSLAPGMLSLMPGLEFNFLLAVTPLVNVVLLGRDLIEGSVDPTLGVVSVLSTTLYAVAAVGLAARIFGTDAIIYGSEARWSDLWQSARESGDVPGASATLLLLAILFPCSFVASGIIAPLARDSAGPALVMSGLATVLLYAGLPILALRLQGRSILRTLGVRGAHPVVFLAAAGLGLGLWPWAHELFLLNQRLGIQAVGPDQVERVRQLLEQWQELSPWLILAALALAPAVSEELLFRGYVLPSLLRSATPAVAVATSAGLFGLFHVVTGSVLAIERLLPSAFLGLVLGWVCWRSRSVLPGMLLHLCHNGLLLMAARHYRWLQERGWDVQGVHLPASWLAAAAAGAALCVGLIALFTRDRSDRSGLPPDEPPVSAGG